MDTPNFELNGDEARGLMLALAQSPANLPSSMVIQLWVRLNTISQVQPPVPTDE